MYYDVNNERLQSLLLAEQISNDAILDSEEVWQAAQAFRAEIRDLIYLDQCLEEEDITP